MLSLLQRLVQDGNALGIRFERLNAANNMLTAALKWGSQAAQAAQADHTTPPLQRPSLPEVLICFEPIANRLLMMMRKWPADPPAWQLFPCSIVQMWSSLIIHICSGVANSQKGGVVQQSHHW